jgi:hypothetical protein
MVTILVLILLGIALLVVLAAMFRSPGGAPAPPAPVVHTPIQPVTKPMETDPWDAKKGDAISISGAAQDYSDLDFTVDRRSAYESKIGRWIDLSGEFRGDRVYLEVYRHPQHLLLGLLDPRKLTLVDIGVTEDQLADFDARQDPRSTLEFEGKHWQYESSREIGYFENETGEGEGLYRWLFTEPGGSRLICVEKWEGEPFDVRIAVIVKPGDVTLYRAA